MCCFFRFIFRSGFLAFLLFLFFFLCSFPVSSPEIRSVIFSSAVTFFVAYLSATSMLHFSSSNSIYFYFALFVSCFLFCFLLVFRQFLFFSSHALSSFFVPFAVAFPPYPRPRLSQNHRSFSFPLIIFCCLLFLSPCA